ncbi:MAG: VWA domain-containing protein [Ardenticatenales bacterium]|nr:VWA domain-containing protein [Ardenticatenales bacterium]
MPRLMRPALAATLALAAALALLAAAPAATSHAVRTHAPEPTATPLPPCAVTATRAVEPLTARVGETVDVTVVLGARCPIEMFPLHIVYVVDASADMKTAEGREVLRSVRRSIAALTPDDRTVLRIGIVGYNSRAAVSCPVSRDTSAAIRCIDRIRPRGEARPEVGLDRALGLLTYARALGGGDRNAIREVIVLVARQPRGVSQCSGALSAAGHIRGQGILLVTACVGDSCDDDCMQSLALTPRYFLDWRPPQAIEQQLDALFRSITRNFSNSLRLWSIAITDTLATSVTLVPNSARPEPNTTGQAPTTLVWRPTHVPKEGWTITYRVRLDAIGKITLPAGGSGSFIDSRHRSGRFDVPPRHIDVLP